MNTSLRLSLLAVFAISLVGVLDLVAPQQAEAQVVIPGDTGGDSGDKKPRRKRCSEGKVRNEDTDGQCCWPGQVWSNDRCIGIPTECPDGYLASSEEQSCVLPTCVGGQVRVDDVYCCWPGQAYSKTRDQCVGVPQCPDGLSVEGESCIGDTDGDGLIAGDKCPDKPEDKDGFKDDDGCPDLDNDEDTIADTADQCPLEAEDLDGYLDTDGCPDLDNDEDGVADVSDQCPDKAGAEDNDGCPKEEVVTNPDPDKPGTSSGGISGMAIGGWSALATGVILAGVGSGLMVAAAGKRDEVTGAETDENGVTTSLTRSEALALESDANTFDTIGVLCIGFGGAAIATGVILLLLDDDGGEADTTVSGAIGPNGEGLLFIGGRF